MGWMQRRVWLHRKKFLYPLSSSSLTDQVYIVLLAAQFASLSISFFSAILLDAPRDLIFGVLIVFTSAILSGRQGGCMIPLFELFL